MYTPHVCVLIVARFVVAFDHPEIARVCRFSISTTLRPHVAGYTIAKCCGIATETGFLHTFGPVPSVLQFLDRGQTESIGERRSQAGGVRLVPHIFDTKPIHAKDDPSALLATSIVSRHISSPFVQTNGILYVGHHGAIEGLAIGRRLGV